MNAKWMNPLRPSVLAAFALLIGPSCAVAEAAPALPLDAKSWTKINHPFLSTDPTSNAFGPGHNGFFKSPNGHEDWIIYHANPAPGGGCKDFRSPRIQRFTWNRLGRPRFGKPAPLGRPLEKPAR
jgi:GH43 family beta-xylosidase